MQWEEVKERFPNEWVVLEATTCVPGLTLAGMKLSKGGAGDE